MMKSKHIFYTRTLADLYWRQGHLSDAEKAYRALIQQEPDHGDYRFSLDIIVQQRRDKKKNDLAHLMRTWAYLLRQEKKRFDPGHGR